MQSEDAVSLSAVSETPTEDGPAIAGKGTEVVALSDVSRLLTRVMAALFALLGLVLFVAPGWASPNFLWKVPPFAMMTMGAWCLGSAAIAFEAGRVWRWPVIYPAMLFLWSFSLLETGVLVVRSNLLRLNAQFGWPYLVVIVAAALISLYGIYDWVRTRPRTSGRGNAMAPMMRGGVAVFVIAVFLIAIFPILGYGKNKQIFPEELTVFTLNAFGVFYLSLVLATLPLLRERSMVPLLFWTRVGTALLYIITLAAIFNLGVFDFGAHPGGLVYWAAYIVVGILTTIFMVRYWSYSRAAEPTA